MSKPKLTPWFPASVTPVRIGLYPVECAHHMKDPREHRRWSFWTGHRWNSALLSPQAALGQPNQEHDQGTRIMSKAPDNAMKPCPFCGSAHLKVLHERAVKRSDAVAACRLP